METMRYSASARLYHWVSAVLVLGLIPVGLYLGKGDPPDGPTTDLLYLLHESFGATLWVLVLIRLAARLINGVPPMPAGTSRLVRGISTLNHGALYAVLLIQPVTGFLANNAGGYPLVWFNLIAIPDPVGKNEKLSEALATLHGYGGWALIALVSLHLAGAAYHALIRRDGVVGRMA
jgi:cytochrome b561